MKLELTKEEVEAALLAYVEQKWPGMFNHVSGTGYRSIDDVVFTLEEPEPEEQEKT